MNLKVKYKFNLNEYQNDSWTNKFKVVFKGPPPLHLTHSIYSSPSMKLALSGNDLRGLAISLVSSYFANTPQMDEATLIDNFTFPPAVNPIRVPVKI